MTSLQIIVEGHGERSAAQLLVRRVLQERLGSYAISVSRPQRRRDIRSLLAREGEALLRFQRVAEMESDAVLWLLDHDDGCVIESLKIAYNLLERQSVRRPTGFAFICREYETLFLEENMGCAEYFGCDPGNLLAGKDKRDAKGHISSTLPSGRVYKATTDQAAITARLNLDRLSEVSHSFRHLENVVSWLATNNPDGLYPCRF